MTTTMAYIGFMCPFDCPRYGRVGQQALTPLLLLSPCVTATALYCPGGHVNKQQICHRILRGWPGPDPPACLWQVCLPALLRIAYSGSLRGATYGCAYVRARTIPRGPCARSGCATAATAYYLAVPAGAMPMLLLLLLLLPAAGAGHFHLLHCALACVWLHVVARLHPSYGFVSRDGAVTGPCWPWPAYYTIAHCICCADDPTG